MIKVENIETYGWEAAIRGMRNPKNSWEKSDSKFQCDDWDNCFTCQYKDVGCHPIGATYIGENDLDLMKRLCKAGTEHRKYLRMITVTMDITCHHAWWAEFDTYKVGTVRNSCSKMHRIHVKEFVADDFSTEGIEECGGRTSEVFVCVLNELERLRRLFNETQEKKYWRAIIELLPMGYNLRATVQFSYENVMAMIKQRENHKLDEWVQFVGILKDLPYVREITGEEE